MVICCKKEVADYCSCLALRKIIRSAIIYCTLIAEKLATLCFYPFYTLGIFEPAGSFLNIEGDIEVNGDVVKPHGVYRPPRRRDHGLQVE